MGRKDKSGKIGSKYEVLGGIRIRCIQQAARIKGLEALMQRAYNYIPKGSSLQKEFEQALKSGK